MYAAFGRGDIQFILNNLTADCRWVIPGEGLPYAGTFTGPSGVARFFEQMLAAETVTAFEPREFYANGDSVVALGSEACTVNATGKPAATNWAMRFSIRDGKVSSFESYFDTLAYGGAYRA
jgi:ketosteroid isomerase-like protein